MKVGNVHWTQTPEGRKRMAQIQHDFHSRKGNGGGTAVRTVKAARTATTTQPTIQEGLVEATEALANATLQFKEAEERLREAVTTFHKITAQLTEITEAIAG